ncbi:MAG TPA: hypothetical protein VKZ91_08470 [Woeseiaceae bacterium]|nr:hypothetical protein [Woeseiaceae bacterium]
MDTTDTSPARGSTRSLLGAAASCVALLAMAWASPGLAAARTSVGCDKVAQELQSLDIDTLTIEVVDLSDVSQSPERSDELADSVAPLLFLTPRVATILEDVFSDSVEPEAVEHEKITQARETKDAKPATSPVVDNANAPDMDASASPMYENAAILPRFQRQMYRTDI